MPFENEEHDLSSGFNHKLNEVQVAVRTRYTGSSGAHQGVIEYAVS